MSIHSAAMTWFGMSVLFVGWLCAYADEKPGEDMKRMREQRKKLAHRKRRIVFNNDGNEPVYYMKEATRKAFLDCRTTPLLGSQVDSILYCTWSSGFSYFTHDTKIGQVFDTTANPDHPHNKRGGFSRNKTAQMLKQGDDPLDVMVEFCKKNNIEVFWSFRMNDTHDAWGSWYGEHLFPQLKKDHPEWLVASKEKRSKHGGWSAMDFNHQEVRDLAVKFIEEVCRNYDVDGVEMDFFRHLIYFRKPAWGEDAGDEERSKMTDMVRRVRAVTEQVGLKRGRPILLSIRVPDSVGYCRAMGLDVEEWLKEGLVDAMAVTGYFRLNPWKVSVDLGAKYGVPVYACLSESRIKGDGGKRRMSLAAYRARALNAWRAGVAGIYLFNSFNPRSPLWRQLGDPEMLMTMDKTYFPTCRGVRAADRFLKDGTRFLGRCALSPERPMKLKPGQSETIEMPMGDDFALAKEKGLNPDIKLRLLFDKPASPQDLTVTVNGHVVSGSADDKGRLAYSPAPDTLVQGMNRFEVTLNPGDKAGAVLKDLGLWVTYPKPKTAK